MDNDPEHTTKATQEKPQKKADLNLTVLSFPLLNKKWNTESPTNHGCLDYRYWLQIL